MKAEPPKSPLESALHAARKIVALSSKAPALADVATKYIHLGQIEKATETLFEATRRAKKSVS